MRKFLLTIILFFFTSSAMAGVCTGRIFNPITDVNWSCMMPISIGAVPMSPPNWLRPDTANFPFPICVCPKGDIPVPGIPLGLWEPTRLVDVTKNPFCFPNMGGISISPGINLGTKTSASKSDADGASGSWYTHWYFMPVLLMLNVFLDAGCLEVTNFDLAYMAELDPTWNDDALSSIFSPEAILFANPVAQAACAADCVAANAYHALDFLHWCAGCQGGMYPMNGNIPSHLNSIQSSLTAVQRTNYKLHRMLQSWITSGPEAICGAIPSPIIKKSQYRTQITMPVPGLEPMACAPYGRSSVLWESLKEIPVGGEDFGYLIWRKRNCCWL